MQIAEMIFQTRSNCRKTGKIMFY
ncbi:MAG: hypothetical protein ACLT0H_02560 [Lachnospiraceae bacterium]